MRKLILILMLSGTLFGQKIDKVQRAQKSFQGMVTITQKYKKNIIDVFYQQSNNRLRLGFRVKGKVPKSFAADIKKAFKGLVFKDKVLQYTKQKDWYLVQLGNKQEGF